jgi:hypothetical protein
VDPSLVSTADLRKLEKYIGNLPPSRRLNLLNPAARRVVADMNDHAYNARVLAYEVVVAPTIRRQCAALEASIQHLVDLQEDILKASGFDLLGPADVAHLSALADEQIVYLKKVEILD